MISPDSYKLLRFMRKNQLESYGFCDAESNFKWTSKKARGVCDDLVEKGYAKDRINHGTHGEAIREGITLTEQGRYFYLFIAIQCAKLLFTWLSAHIVELAALALSIIALINSMS